jgi:hypothetical protein
MNQQNKLEAALPKTVRAILHTLLDRAERPQRQQIVRMRIDESHFPDYWNQHDVRERREVNAALLELERLGLVRLHWQKFEEKNWLSAVDLVSEQIGSIYDILKRTPYAQQETALRSLLAEQIPIPGWHADFLDWVHTQLSRSRSIAPLDLQDPQKNANLLIAISTIAQLDEPVLERILSIRLFNDSKRLETLLDAILLLLRRHDPDATLYGKDTNALLLAHHIARVPEHILIAGQLELQMKDAFLAIAPFKPSVAISAATLHNATSITCAARQVITIENATSFSELAAIGPDRTLLVFTSGFASPAILTLLQALQAAHHHLKFFHWGDIDVGGLRILEHLRRHVAPILPLGMDITIFKEHLAFGQPLSKEELDALRKLLDHDSIKDCVHLIEMMIYTGKKLEQEAIRPSRVLQP